MARRDWFEAARSFLGPLPVETLLETLGRSTGDSEEAPSGKGSAPAGRGASAGVDFGDGRRVVLKALRRGGLPGRLRGGYHGGARLMAEMAILEEAANRGVPTAPLAFGATARRGGGAEASVLATVEIPGVASLGEIVESGEEAAVGRSHGYRRRGDAAPGKERPGRLRALRAPLEAAGRAACRAHDLGLDHADLNIGNILLLHEGAGWRGFIIDLGLSELGGPVEPGRRAANLVRLLRSAAKHLGEDPRQTRDAAAFLHGYLSSRPDPHRLRRRELLAAIRRRLPTMMIHRLGWRVLGRG